MLNEDLNNNQYLNQNSQLKCKISQSKCTIETYYSLTEYKFTEMEHILEAKVQYFQITALVLEKTSDESSDV